MRALLVAAVVFVAALAGCSGKKGDDHEHLTYTCPNGTVISEEDYEGVLDNITVDFLKTKCPKSGSGSGSKSNTTSLAPNVLPTLKLTVKDFAGNVTNITFVDGNLTFDATGSMDPDGTISAIAISVQDSNTTRTRSLYDFATKTFTPVMFSFDRPGVVNVSVAMVDDRAGFTNNVTHAYVNQMVEVGGEDLVAPAEQNTDMTDPCVGARNVLDDAAPLAHSYYFVSKGVAIVNGATFIEATPNADSLITICTPDGTAISDPVKSDAKVTSTNTEPLTVAKATESYQIAFYAGGAQATVGATVIVHYEPRPAAAAA